MAIELIALSDIQRLADKLYGRLKNVDDVKVLVEIEHKLEMLERYLLQIDEHTQAAEAIAEYYQRVPMKESAKWHDILANPEKFPTLDEKFGGNKK